MKINNVIRIPSSLDGSLFRYWVEFLKPFHNLTARESDILAALIKKRYSLSKVIKDDAILDKVLMSEDVKNEICEECNITKQYLQVILSTLRKNNLVVNEKINPRFIPNIDEESGSFKLMLLFDF